MKNILIVDDDRTIRFLYKEELTYEGYNVITTGDCRKLRELIDTEKPDLVVLEAVIGKYNGLDLLQKIRNTYYDLPVILCTAYSSFKNDPRSIAADYCVLKSSDLSKLKQKIKMAIEAGLQFPEDTISDESTPHLAGISRAGQDVGPFIA
jgi:two-component system response regulator (stage 0 sporulation protein F)